jgi:hypothetical protein
VNRRTFLAALAAVVALPVFRPQMSSKNAQTRVIGGVPPQTGLLDARIWDVRVPLVNGVWNLPRGPFELVGLDGDDMLLRRLR